VHQVFQSQLNQPPPSILLRSDWLPSAQAQVAEFAQVRLTERRLQLASYISNRRLDQLKCFECTGQAVVQCESETVEIWGITGSTAGKPSRTNAEAFSVSCFVMGISAVKSVVGVIKLSLKLKYEKVKRGRHSSVVSRCHRRYCAHDYGTLS
jgi:hypothetical protein